MRVAVGGYLVAVNTFVEQRMGLELFQRSVVAGDALLNAGSGDSAIYGFLEGARQRQWDAVPLQFMFPGVGGKATRDAHEWAKDRFLEQLRQAGPVDGIFIQLHGTGAAEHLDDCEGDLLAAIREAVGDKVVLMASLDGHANVTPADGRADRPVDRRQDQSALRLRAGRPQGRPGHGRDVRRQPVADHGPRPTGHVAGPCKKLYIAPGWPMEHLMRQAQNLAAGDARILDVSLLEGFFCSEIPETGMSVVVTTDGEPNLAQDVAEQIKEACWAKRQSFHTDMVSVEEAVREAIATEVGPVILGDLADSGGAGTPGDGTAILAEFLKQGASGAVVGNIADPEAVQAAIQAGVGKNVSLSVGGKADRFHGDPVEISGRVRSIHQGVFTTGTAFISMTFDRGPTVVIDCGGIEVILTSRPVLVFEPNHFRSLGIEPTERKILACKAEMQHRAGFAEVAAKIIDVDTPGLATQILSRLPYAKIRRPVFPLDDI